MLQPRPNTFAQTLPSLSFFACDQAADHTFRIAEYLARIGLAVNGVLAGKAVGCHVVTITTSFAEILLLRNAEDQAVHSFYEAPKVADRMLNLDSKIGELTQRMSQGTYGFPVRLR